MTSTVRFALVIALSALPVGALAQDSSMQAPEVELDSFDQEARALYEAGRIAYAEGRFENALDHFQRAYSLSGRSVLLFNVALSASNLRRDREALEAFEAYLEALPDAENRAAVESRIEVLRQAADAADETTASTSASSGDAPAPEPAPAAPPSGPDPVLIGLGASALALGLIGGSLGTASLVDAASNYATHEAQVDLVTRECDAGIATVAQCDVRRATNDDNAAAISEREVLGAVGLAVGGALSVTGVVLLVVGASAGSSNELTVRCGPTLMGARCDGRF